MNQSKTILNWTKWFTKFKYTCVYYTNIHFEYDLNQPD